MMMGSMHKHKVLSDFKIVAVNFYTEPAAFREPLYSESASYRETHRIKEALVDAWKFTGESDVDEFLQDCKTVKPLLALLYRGPPGECWFKESWEDGLMYACEYVIVIPEERLKTDREHARHALKRNDML